MVHSSSTYQALPPHTNHHPVLDQPPPHRREDVYHTLPTRSHEPRNAVRSMQVFEFTSASLRFASLRSALTRGVATHNVGICCDDQARQGNTPGWGNETENGYSRIASKARIRVSKLGRARLIISTRSKVCVQELLQRYFAYLNSVLSQVYQTSVGTYAS
jgi:hypothetical protein